MSWLTNGNIWKYRWCRNGFGDLVGKNVQVATHNLPAAVRPSRPSKVVAATVCHSASLRNSSCAGEFMEDRWHWERQLQAFSIQITRFTRCRHYHQPGINFWNTAASGCPPPRQWPFAPAILVSWFGSRHNHSSELTDLGSRRGWNRPVCDSKVSLS